LEEERVGEDGLEEEEGFSSLILDGSREPEGEGERVKREAEDGRE